MTSQHDVQTLSSITTIVDLEYTLLFFPPPFMIQLLTLIEAFACNHSFETLFIFSTLLNSVVSLLVYWSDRPTQLPSACFSLSVL